MKADTGIPLIVIVGPTATGKTRLAIRIAQELGGEIISADSMQIYKDMDIATAKPTKEELKRATHHLVSFLDVKECFSVAQYKRLADKAILEVHKKGKLPILAGGTGLYVNTVVDNIKYLDNAGSDRIRRELWEQERVRGIDSIYNELKAVDPKSAEKIDAKNKKRVIRAMEVYRVTGKTFSYQIEKSKEQGSPYELKMIGLDFRDRQKLYDRINTRVDEMLNRGLLEEARIFLSSEVSKTAIGAIGYKELAAYFDGKLPLVEAVDNLKRSSRRYAKRQRTWFRKDDRIQWLYIDDYGSFEEVQLRAIEILR